MLYFVNISNIFIHVSSFAMTDNVIGFAFGVDTRMARFPEYPIKHKWINYNWSN